MIDVDRLVAETFLRRVTWHEETASTNDLALQLAGTGDIVTPLLIGATRQLAGRGRGTNRWWGGTGTLMFSVLFDMNQLGLPQTLWPRFSLVTGLSVAEALEVFLPDAAIGLKWPNDVWLYEKKVCGILIEQAQQFPGRLVAGLGWNVNTSFSQAPDEIKGIATSMSDVSGMSFDFEHVLRCFLQRWEGNLDALIAGKLDLIDRWGRFCALSGYDVRLMTDEFVSHGRCLGVASDGALRLMVDGTERHCYAGTVRRSDLE